MVAPQRGWQDQSKRWCSGPTWLGLVSRLRVTKGCWSGEQRLHVSKGCRCSWTRLHRWPSCRRHASVTSAYRQGTGRWLRGRGDGVQMRTKRDGCREEKAASVKLCLCRRRRHVRAAAGGAVVWAACRCQWSAGVCGSHGGKSPDAGCHTTTLARHEGRAASAGSRRSRRAQSIARGEQSGGAAAGAGSDETRSRGRAAGARGTGSVRVGSMAW